MKKIVSMLLVFGIILGSLCSSIVVTANTVSTQQITEFTKLKHRSIGGNTSVNDEGAESILTFKRNYANANTWSGGSLQLKTDNNEFYKLQPATTYRVKFNYCVESYNEASDAEFKDLSIMVATSKEGENNFTNARSVTAKDLDSMSYSHKANTEATSGDYAAVGARVPYNAAGYGCTSGSHNWQNVTAEFTTKDSLTNSSGTFDILTIGIISNKTDAGDIQVSFKNVSVEVVDKWDLLGDVNGDNIVNIIDLVKMKKYIVDPDNTVISVNNANIIPDEKANKIDAQDLSALRQILLGIKNF